LQDYLFVQEFSRTAGRLLAAAPPRDFPLVMGGIAALDSELAWFSAAAREKQPAPHPVNEEYWALMRKIGADTYAVQLAAFWAIERVYNEGWRLSSGAAREPFVECQRRWSSHAFTG
ncbi:unnamed protein product, partial [Phaeothamnion confervicola]